MYESFFGFVKRPFVAAPTLDRYFPSGTMEQTLQTASRAISRAEGPVAIFGGTGLGKTMCCLRLAEYFQRNFEVVMLSSSQLITRRALLQNLLYELNMPYRDLSEGELRLTLMNRLQPSTENPSDGLLLVVDEAQTLSHKLLDEIRLLTNVQKNGSPRVRLVLCGTIKLEEILCSPQMDSLNQRLAARCYLTPLSLQETMRYVMHKIELSGVDYRSVIKDDALEAIYRGTDGIPRLIDQLADQTLLLACSERERPISSGCVGKAWGMLQQLPNPWSEPESIVSPSLSPLTSTTLPQSSFAFNPPVSPMPTTPMSTDRGAEQGRSSLLASSLSYAGPFDQTAPASPAIRIDENTRAPSSEQPFTKIAAALTPIESPSLIEFGTLEDNEDSVNATAEDSDVGNQREWNGQTSVLPFSKQTTPSPDAHENEYRLAPENTVRDPWFSGNAKPANKGTNLLDVFGSDFDEEFNLPVQSSDGYQSYSGVAFGNLNHDLHSFEANSNSNSFELEEASDFIPRQPNKASKDNLLANAFFPGSSQRQPETQLPTFASNISPAQAASLERQIEDEMRELVSDLNLNAMTFDPGQSIVAAPTPLRNASANSLFSEQNVASFSQMSQEWNEGEFYDSVTPQRSASAPLAPIGDDRDLLVIEEDLEPQRAGVHAGGTAVVPHKATLHPYAKLFSNLRSH